MDLTRLIPIYTTVDKICIETGESIDKKMPCLFDPELNVYYCDSSLTFVIWFNHFQYEHEYWKENYLNFLYQLLADADAYWDNEQSKKDDFYNGVLMDYYGYDEDSGLDFPDWLEENGLD